MVDRLQPHERTYILNGLALTEQHTTQLETQPTNTNMEDPDDDDGNDNYSSTNSSSSSSNNSKTKKTSLLLTSATLTNSLVGAGILGTPFALQEAGFMVGLVLLILVGLVTDQSLVLQMAAGRAVGANTYQECVGVLFGRPGFVLCAVLQFCFPFVGLVSYNIIVGDVVPKIISRFTTLSSSSLWLRRELVTTLTTLIITLPLSLFRNIAYLSNVSAMSIVMVTVILTLMMARAPEMATLVHLEEEPLSIINTGIGSAIGILAFGYVCHQTSFLIYNSLDNNTQERWDKTVHISVATALLLYMGVAITGYLSFKSFLQGDLFENYCWGDDVMNAGRLFFSFTVLCTYPLECFACREVLQTSFFRNYESHAMLIHVLLTLGVTFSSLFLSFVTDCLAIVLQINGILIACPMAFILPGACFIKATGGPVLVRGNITALLVIGFGVFAMVCGIITMGVNYATISECSHGNEMPYCKALTHNNATTLHRHQ